jgi:hypothetical protein
VSKGKSPQLTPSLLYIAAVKTDPVDRGTENPRKANSKKQKARMGSLCKEAKDASNGILRPCSGQNVTGFGVHALKGEGDVFSQKKF